MLLEVTTMNSIYDELIKAYESIKDKITAVPKVALVLGTGLGDFAENIDNQTIIDYEDIEGFPQSTAPGHVGRYVLGYIGGVPVVAMQGRIHYYEGYAMDKVVMPVRLMKMMGAEILVLTNAAGGINKSFKRGDLMIINDHITSYVPSPLVGPNIDEFGERFPDMTEVYDSDLRNLLKLCAMKNDISIKNGVYLQVTGPNYETPTEIEMYRKNGADAVGMSTACEAMAANHMGMKICGVSCITNLASGMANKPLNHKEVEETAAVISDKFKRLIIDFVKMTEE